MPERPRGPPPDGVSRGGRMRKTAFAAPPPGRARKCPRSAAPPPPPAAIAPVKPATNDVHPERNAASPLKLSRRYTYSPPAWGRLAASSAYASAPANASAPPIAHTESIAVLSGRMVATNPGVVKMPTPMTLEMTIAAASSGPRRRSSDADWGRVTRAAPASFDDQHAHDGKVAKAHPLRRAVFAGELDLRVDKLGVLQHLLTRLVGAGVPELRCHRQRRRRGARRQAFGTRRLNKAAAPLVLFVHAAEQRVHLKDRQPLVRHVPQLERD